MTFPEASLDLLRAPGTGTLSTHAPNGLIQTTAIWHLLDGDELKFSLSDARKKLRNLQENPKATYFVLDPANPFHYVEVRGQVTIEPDPDKAFMTRVGEHYGSDLSGIDQPGDQRFVVTMHPERVNAQ